MWKSLKNEFPPFKDEGWRFCTDEVLICVGEEILIGFAQRYDIEDEWMWKLQGRDEYDVDGVTHWMELPASPK